MNSKSSSSANRAWHGRSKGMTRPTKSFCLPSRLLARSEVLDMLMVVQVLQAAEELNIARLAHINLQNFSGQQRV